MTKYDRELTILLCQVVLNFVLEVLKKSGKSLEFYFTCTVWLTKSVICKQLVFLIGTSWIAVISKVILGTDFQSSPPFIIAIIDLCKGNFLLGPLFYPISTKLRLPLLPVHPLQWISWFSKGVSNPSPFTNVNFLSASTCPVLSLSSSL